MRAFQIGSGVGRNRKKIGAARRRDELATHLIATKTQCHRGPNPSSNFAVHKSQLDVSAQQAIYLLIAAFRLTIGNLGRRGKKRIAVLMEAKVATSSIVIAALRPRKPHGVQNGDSGVVPRTTRVVGCRSKPRLRCPRLRVPLYSTNPLQRSAAASQEVWYCLQLCGEGDRRDSQVRPQLMMSLQLTRFWSMKEIEREGSACSALVSSEFEIRVSCQDLMRLGCGFRCTFCQSSIICGHAAPFD